MVFLGPTQRKKYRNNFVFWTLLDSELEDQIH